MLGERCKGLAPCGVGVLGVVAASDEPAVPAQRGTGYCSGKGNKVPGMMGRESLASTQGLCMLPGG